MNPERTFEHALAHIRRALRDRVTPGAQLSVAFRKQNHWHRANFALGHQSYDPDAPRVTEATLYDLASVTKAIVALAFVRVADRERFALTEPARALWIESNRTRYGEATVDALLSHRANLAAWKPLFAKVKAIEAGTESARSVCLETLLQTPGEPWGGQVCYSDLGYITVGMALEALAKESLSQVILHEIIAPLGLSSDALVYRPVIEGHSAPWALACAPTEACAWRDRVVHGQVHDENAFALGGVCGHAGLFGTAQTLCDVGVATLDALANRERAWLSAVRVESMIAARPGGSHRLGWDGKSAQGSSAGTRASARTFGHLGFTGTMLWCDPDAEVAVALVTNRVHPTRENQGIRTLRPLVMDAVLHACAAPLGGG
ncbi:MAG: serine hydrolase domain-containing protein [Deltaproteobacteria bacterium]|nr:serine hydrolase domain-containing protein [Deltaproteobacteria bacterium]